jgi:hypothetical protein
VDTEVNEHLSHFMNTMAKQAGIDDPAFGPVWLLCVTEDQVFHIDSLLDIWTNLCYVQGGRVCQWQERNLPSPPPPHSAKYAPELYPTGGAWPTKIAQSAEHLFQSPSLVASPGCKIGGGYKEVQVGRYLEIGFHRGCSLFFSMEEI